MFVGSPVDGPLPSFHLLAARSGAAVSVGSTCRSPARSVDSRVGRSAAFSPVRGRPRLPPHRHHHLAAHQWRSVLAALRPRRHRCFFLFCNVPSVRNTMAGPGQKRRGTGGRGRGRGRGLGCGRGRGRGREGPHSTVGGVPCGWRRTFCRRNGGWAREPDAEEDPVSVAGTASRAALLC